MRVRDKSVDLQRSPSAKAAALAKVPRHTALFVLGAQADWYRVEYPGGGVGYLPVQATTATLEPLRRETLPVVADLLVQPYLGAPQLDSLPARSKVAVLGEYGLYRLVRSQKGELGWLLSAPKKSST